MRNKQKEQLQQERKKSDAESNIYQEQAAFHHKPRRTEDITEQHASSSVPERQTNFRVEKTIVLTDMEYRQFKETGLMEDQIFLFDNSDKMWFDPGTLCWHCLLIKGESSKDGILVEAEG